MGHNSLSLKAVYRTGSALSFPNNGHFSVLPLRAALAIWLPPLCQGKHVGLVVIEADLERAFTENSPVHLSLSLLLSFPSERTKTSPCAH